MMMAERQTINQMSNINYKSFLGSRVWGQAKNIVFHITISNILIQRFTKCIPIVIEQKYLRELHRGKIKV